MVQGKTSLTVADSFIEGKKSMTLTEARLFAFLVSMVDPLAGEFEDTYTLSVRKFSNAYLIKPNDLYRFLDQLTDELLAKSFAVKGEKGFDKISWIDRATYNNGEGTLTIRLSESIKPVLHGLRRNFTTTDLRDFQQLRSKYSFWFLMLAAKWVKVGSRDFALDELRPIVGAEHYTRFNDFRSRVLEPAAEELRKHTAFLFQWDVTRKVGKSPAELSLTFKRNKKVINQRLKQPFLPFPSVLITAIQTWSQP